jgi:hypothetical protein
VIAIGCDVYFGHPWTDFRSFYGGNRGSNPLGDANKIKWLRNNSSGFLPLFCRLESDDHGGSISGHVALALIRTFREYRGRLGVKFPSLRRSRHQGHTAGRSDGRLLSSEHRPFPLRCANHRSRPPCRVTRPGHPSRTHLDRVSISAVAPRPKTWSAGPLAFVLAGLPFCDPVAQTFWERVIRI